MGAARCRQPHTKGVMPNDPPPPRGPHRVCMLSTTLAIGLPPAVSRRPICSQPGLAPNMAVVLSLKDVHYFPEEHPNAKAHYGDAHKTPILHFNILFRCLFGLHKLPHGLEPHSTVDMLRAFLRWVTRDICWLIWRVSRYLWALRTRRRCLRQYVFQRRRRVQEALQRWEAHDEQLERDFKARQREVCLAPDLPPVLGATGVWISSLEGVADKASKEWVQQCNRRCRSWFWPT